MRKAAIRALMTRAAVGGRAVDRGSDLVNQVTATASEFIRLRRDVSVIAERRRRVARRRVTLWGGVSTAAAGFEAYGITTMAGSGVTGGDLALAILFGALLIWALVNLIRAASDLRRRGRVVRSLPPPQPSRPPVAGPARSQMTLLDGYSDGLRQLVGMIGVAGSDPAVLELRNGTLAAADAAESRLRRQADEYSGLVRARGSAPAAARNALSSTADSLLQEIESGVRGYGDLVTATSHTVAASRELAAGLPGPADPLQETTEELRALTTGMRELSGS